MSEGEIDERLDDDALDVLRRLYAPTHALYTDIRTERATFEPLANVRGDEIDVSTRVLTRLVLRDLLIAHRPDLRAPRTRYRLTPKGIAAFEQARREGRA